MPRYPDLLYEIYNVLSCHGSDMTGRGIADAINNNGTYKRKVSPGDIRGCVCEGDEAHSLVYRIQNGSQYTYALY